jgi:hypothetical protein
MIMIMKILLFLFSAIFISCEGYTKSFLDTHYSLDEKLSLKIDSIVIPLDSISLPVYLSRASYYENDTSSFLYVFNNKTWNIDVFNLKESRIEGHIHLLMEGNNGVNDVISLQVISMDSILIYDGINYIFLNKYGHVIRRINGIIEKDGFTGTLDANGFTVPRYISPENRIYGRYMTSREPYLYPEKELFAFYDIATEHWEVLSPVIPNYFENNWTYLGMNNRLNINVSNDRISYTFSALPEVFVYFFNENKEMSSGGESRITNNSVYFYNGHSDLAKLQHWFDNPVFGPLIYNSDQKLYYRQMFGEFIKEPLYSPNGDFLRKTYLSVFDDSLHIIFETELPNYKFNFSDFFMSKKGLLIYGNNPFNPNINDEELVVYCLRVDILGC